MEGRSVKMIYSESEWEFVAENEKLIRAVIAREKLHLLDMHLALLEYDDLMSVGRIGMIKAVHAYNAARGAMSTICSRAIRHEISNEVKRQLRAGREPQANKRNLSLDRMQDEGERSIEAQLYTDDISPEDIAQAHILLDIAKELCKQGRLKKSEAEAWAQYMGGRTYASIGEDMGLTAERIRQKVEKANSIIREYVFGTDKEHWQKVVEAGKYAVYAGKALMLDKCSPEKVGSKLRFTAHKNEIEPIGKDMRYDLDKMVRNAMMYKDGELYRVSWLGIRWLERITGMEIVEKKDVARK